MVLDKLFILSAEFIGAFIGASELVGPLLVLDTHATISMLILLHAFITFALVRLIKITTTCGQVLAKFESLSGAS